MTDNRYSGAAATNEPKFRKYSTCSQQAKNKIATFTPAPIPAYAPKNHGNYDVTIFISKWIKYKIGLPLNFLAFMGKMKSPVLLLFAFMNMFAYYPSLSIICSFLFFCHVFAVTIIIVFPSS